MSDHSHDDLEDRLARLEVLEERIQRLEHALARREQGPSERYYESGSEHPELDDQGIAP